jgi:uncharacterized protein YdiU (UPF0061 family)
MWNLGRLAAALYPLIEDEERLHRGLELYRDTFGRAYGEMLAAKLGLSALSTEEDQQLVDEMSALMRESEADYTLFFRRLADYPAEATDATPESLLDRVAPTFYNDAITADLRGRWLAWAGRYAQRVRQDASPIADRAASMRRATPKYVPRNYLAQLAINAAEAGDASVLDRLFRVLREPYAEQPGEDDLAAMRPEWATNTPGCSALSCSS